MSPILKYSLIVVFILIVLSGFGFLSGSFSPSPERIPLSQLVSEINEGKVQKITVHGDTINIDLNNNAAKQIAQKETESSLSESLNNLGVDKVAYAKVSVEIQDQGGFSYYLSQLIPILLPFAFFGVILWLMFRQAQKGSMSAFNFGKSKARLASSTNGRRRVTFKDVAGLTEAKEEVSEIIEFLRDPEKFHKLGARMPRGVLLIGTPGTGKTLLARAVANEADVPFHFVSGSEFVEMFVGVGATRVRDTFETAKKTSPSIIFIDEIDAVGRHRGAGLGGGHDEREQTLNQILVEMDGFDTNDTVVVMAATNRPDILDPALLRPGRFDRRIILDEPSLNDREAILNIHATDLPLADDVQMRVVAERTPGFSGADLANLVNEAAIIAARNNLDKIHQVDFFQAIEKVMLGPERRSHVLSKKEKEITAYHEAGHALVAASLLHTDPVHKVSIVARGRAGGYTLKLPSEDKHLRTRSEFESELSVLLGGYASEQTAFDELTTGASNDLKIASDLARKMITQFGMSDSLGPIVFGENEELVFLGRDLGHHKNYSNEIAFQIDTEIKRLISSALEKAKSILTEKRAILDRIAKTLIEKETLEQKEFYALLK